MTKIDGKFKNRLSSKNLAKVNLRLFGHDHAIDSPAENGFKTDASPSADIVPVNVSSFSTLQRIGGIDAIDEQLQSRPDDDPSREHLRSQRAAAGESD